MKCLSIIRFCPFKIYTVARVINTGACNLQQFAYVTCIARAADISVGTERTRQRRHPSLYCVAAELGRGRGDGQAGGPAVRMHDE